MFEFPLTLDALDGVPTNFQALYAKGDDGKFSLNADLAKKLDVSGLTTALDKERKANKANGENLKAWQKLGIGETLEDAANKLKELNERATNGDGKANWEKMKTDLEAGHIKALSEKDKTVDGMRKTLESHLVDKEAVTAITEHKGAAALLLPHVRSQVKVFEDNGSYTVRVVDKDGDPRGDGKGGFMGIKELVAEMKASQEFGRAFEASGTGGSGKPPASSKTGKEGAGTGRDGMSSVDKIAAGLRAQQRR
jgi:hypothetical protein